MDLIQQIESVIINIDTNRYNSWKYKFELTSHFHDFGFKTLIIKKLEN